MSLEVLSKKLFVLLGIHRERSFFKFLKHQLEAINLLFDSLTFLQECGELESNSFSDPTKGEKFTQTLMLEITESTKVQLILRLI
jgi:hypothetical protein